MEFRVLSFKVLALEVRQLNISNQ